MKNKLAIGFAVTMRLLSNYFDLLFLLNGIEFEICENSPSLEGLLWVTSGESNDTNPPYLFVCECLSVFLPLYVFLRVVSGQSASPAGISNTLSLIHI